MGVRTDETEEEPRHPVTMVVVVLVVVVIGGHVDLPCRDAEA
ncbi:MAG TPA: hypothetical protein VE991_12990 [Acidimicrobiales bacterium]|nr:hypothetical protein [Acidimicrobiales bacterium]